MKAYFAALTLLLCASHTLAKLPPPPPADPAKTEEARQKDTEAKQKAAELQAKYEDKAVAAFAAKAKAEGKEFKPQLGPGVPAPAASPVAAAPVAATAPPVPAKK
jgi:hypothetical protein